METRVRNLGSGIRGAATTSEALPHRPDAYLVLRFPAAAGGQQRSHLYYEADRDTTNTTRFRLKLVAYSKFFQSGQYTEKYGAGKVRAVLVETTSIARMEQLKRVAGELAQSEPLAAMLFWFSSSGLIRDNGIFGAVWKCAGDSRQRSLLD